MSGSPADAVATGRAWEEFCDVLRRAGRQILRPEAPADPLTRAEGFRYLSRLVRLGLEMQLECGDAAFPSFCVPSHETAKIGADNPDTRYHYARLDPRHDYRVRGRLGTAHYLSFGTQKGGYERDGRMEPTGFVDVRGLALEPGGRFELVISQRRHEGNWLPMEPATNALVVRETFRDRRTETPAVLAIERLGGGATPAPLSPARLHAGLAAAAGFVEGTARLFADWAAAFQRHTNALPPADQARCRSAGGDPNVFYYHSVWSLEDDEALLIEVDAIPACETWNVQVNNYWMESLDYRHHRIALNAHTARPDDDGGVTLAIAHRDPGLPNWLETAGHRVGTVCFRWVGATHPVHPRTRVVRLAPPPP